MTDNSGQMSGEARICTSCGGILGRDCWNPQECAQITAQVQFEPTQADDLRKPVAWRVKDFADGWFYYGPEQWVEADRAAHDGFLVEPLYLAARAQETDKAGAEIADWRARAMKLLETDEAAKAEIERLRAIIRDGLAVIDRPEFHRLAERNSGALLMYTGPRLDVEAIRKALSTPAQAVEEG